MDRRTVLSGAGALAAALLGGCTGGSDGGTATVEVGPEDERVFRPGTDEPLTIDAGTAVTFVWRSDGHNVSVRDQPDDADWGGHEGVEDEGFEHEHAFDVEGEYRYACEPHEAQGMVGEVVVEGGGGGYY